MDHPLKTFLKNLGKILLFNFTIIFFLLVTLVFFLSFIFCLLFICCITKLANLFLKPNMNQQFFKAEHSNQKYSDTVNKIYIYDMISLLKYFDQLSFSLFQTLSRLLFTTIFQYQLLHALFFFIQYLYCFLILLFINTNKLLVILNLVDVMVYFPNNLMKYQQNFELHELKYLKNLSQFNYSRQKI